MDHPSAETDACDYRRGRRFKRITRMLNGESCKRRLRRFTIQGYGVAVFISVATVVCYVSMLFLLETQEKLVESLNVIGHAAEECSHSYISALSLGTLYMNRGDSDLPKLTGPQDISSQTAFLEEHAVAFLDYLTTSYYQVTKMPSTKLRDIWIESSTALNIYHNEYPGEPLTMRTTNYSLWDAGKLFAKSAFALVQNGAEYNKTVNSTNIMAQNGRTWIDSADAHFMIDNMKSITDQLFVTLDIVVEVVIESTLQMNQVQYIFLAVEGVVCSTLAIVFIAYVATQMTTNRWILYNVFMMVPVGLTKALANKTLMLDDGETKPQDGPSEGEGGKTAMAGSAIKINGNDASMKQNAFMTFCSNFCGCLMFWRKKSSAVSPVYAKRQLVYSRRSVYLLCSLFLVWGIMMIAINAAGHSALATVPEPIAIFNLVNFVYVRHTRSVAWLEELAVQTNYTEADIKRAILRKRYNLPFDYLVMLNGNSAAPGQTSAHYTLATKGVADTPEGRAVLYDLRGCMRQDVSTCLHEDSSLYPFVTKGLDMVMQHYMYTVETCLNMHENNPKFESEEFFTVWNTRADINGGLIKLNKIFFNKVISVYTQTLTVHTIGLVVTILLMGIYCLFILRPLLKRIRSETRRIAELLNQLPTEVDVEGLVRKTQQMQNSKGSSSGNSLEESSFVGSSAFSASEVAPN